MNNVRWDMAGIKKLGSAKLTLNSAATTAFDFGTPDNLYLPTLAGYKHGDRILVVLSATTAGTDDALTWVLQDADDNAGAIGTPATAVSSVVAGGLSAGTSDDFSVFAVKIQNGRPWLKISATRVGTTDTHVCHCTVYAVPSNV